MSLNSPVAIPIAWYTADRWLSDFAFRVDISIWIFVLSGLLSVAITLVTIGFHAVKAAIANPVEALRYE